MTDKIESSAEAVALELMRHVFSYEYPGSAPRPSTADILRLYAKCLLVVNGNLPSIAENMVAASK